MSTQDEDRRAEQRFARVAGGLLRQGAGELDAPTLSRLNRGRQAALAAHDRARLRPVSPGGGWQAMAAAAAVAVVAVGLWTGRLQPPDGSQTVADVPRPEQTVDVEEVLMEGNLDLIENLEFYDWLGSGSGADADRDPAG